MSYILLFQQFIYLFLLHYLYNLHAFTYRASSSSLVSTSTTSLLLFNCKFIRNNKNSDTLHQQYQACHHYQQHHYFHHNHRYDYKLHSTKISWNQIPLRNNKGSNDNNNDDNSINSIKNKMSFLLSDNNRNSHSNSDIISSSSSSIDHDLDQVVTVVSIDELQSYWIDKCIDDSKPEELNNFKLRHVIPMLHDNNKYCNNTFIQLVNRTLEHNQLVDDITVTFITG